MTKTFHLFCLITRLRDGGRGGSAYSRGGRLFLISANRRGAYSKGARLFRRGCLFEGRTLIPRFTVTLLNIQNCIVADEVRWIRTKYPTFEFLIAL